MGRGTPIRVIVGASVVLLACTGSVPTSGPRGCAVGQFWRSPGDERCFEVPPEMTSARGPLRTLEPEVCLGFEGGPPPPPPFEVEDVERCFASATDAARYEELIGIYVEVALDDDGRVTRLERYEGPLPG